MGQQIIKQPNGKYCIFSSVVDNIIYYDMTKDEIIEAWTEEAKERIERDVNKTIKQLENNEKPYSRFTMSFDRMLLLISQRHGKEEMKEVKSLIEQKNE